MLYSEIPELNLKPHYTTWILPRTYDIDQGIRNKPLAEWSKQFCNEGTFLDLNAGFGEMALVVASSVVKVWAVEKNHEAYLALCGNIFLNNWTNVITPFTSVDDIPTLPIDLSLIYGKIEEVEKLLVRLFYSLDPPSSSSPTVVGGPSSLLEKKKPTMIIQGNKQEIEIFSNKLATPTKGSLYQVLPIDNYEDYWLLRPK